MKIQTDFFLFFTSWCVIRTPLQKDITVLASAATFENNPSPALEMRETSTYTLQEEQGMELVTGCSFNF